MTWFGVIKSSFLSKSSLTTLELEHPNQGVENKSPTEHFFLEPCSRYYCKGKGKVHVMEGCNGMQSRYQAHLTSVLVQNIQQLRFEFLNQVKHLKTWKNRISDPIRRNLDHIATFYCCCCCCRDRRLLCSRVRLKIVVVVEKWDVWEQ